MSLSLPQIHTPDEIEADRAEVEARIHGALNSDVRLIPEVGGYLVDSGGKRVRPMLHILACRLCGYEGRAHIDVAAALELIHAATLLHDDVVDQAKLRRGKAAAHLVWSNSSSVLVGDFMFARSFMLMVRAGSLRVMEIISDVCSRMAEGEALQLTLNASERTRREDYAEVIRKKTAILFAAASQLGGVLAGAGAERERGLFLFGEAVGMAFQIIDDALDFTAEPGQWGKAVGKDIEEGKITLPLIEALESGDPESGAIMEMITRFSRRNEEARPEDLERIILFVRRNGGVDRSLAEARRKIEEARHLLQDFPDRPERAALDALADFVASRQS